MRRALQQQVPKTLTAHEWQQWYADNGVPQEHRKTDGWLKRQWGLIKEALAGLTPGKRNKKSP